MPIRKLTYIIVCLFMMISCSVNKFVPEGEYLLKDVKIVSNTNTANVTKARDYVRQMPNAKWFSIAKVPLYTYALSGRDTTIWINRVLQRIGEAPVIYNEALAERSRRNIEQMLVNDGYLHATVDFACEKRDKKKRAVATYYLHERERYFVSEIALNTADSALSSLIDLASEESLLRTGMPFSIDGMEHERSRLTKLFRDKGYYRFQKDYITFTADTAHHSNKVDLTMNIAMFAPTSNDSTVAHKSYRIGDIYYVTGVGMRFDEAALSKCDTLKYLDYNILYKENNIILRFNFCITFSRLPILKRNQI